MKVTHAIIYTLICLILGIFALNVYLYVADPYGSIRYQNDRQLLFATLSSAPEGYAIAEGTHHLQGYTFTANERGNRIVPQTNHQADCTAVMLGDSVSFGMGSNLSFVDVIAEKMPDVHWVNSAKPGYSTLNVLPSMEANAGDVYIYYAVLNDEGEMRNYEDYVEAGYSGQPMPLWDFSPLRHYLIGYWLPNPVTSAPYPMSAAVQARWIEAMNALKPIDNLLILAWDATTADIHDLPLIDYERLHISRADGHLSDEGNLIAGEALYPHIAPFVEQHCKV